MIPDRPQRAHMLLLLLLLVLFFFSFLFCERQIKIIVWSSPVLRLRARPLQTQVATSCDFLQHATVHELGTINITTSCHGIRIIRCISRYIPIYIFLSLSLVTYTLVWHATQKSVSLIIIIISLLHYTVYILYSSRYKLSHTIAYLPYLPLDFFCSIFFLYKMENSDLLTVAASIAVIIWSVVMNTLYDAEQHREKKMMMISKGRRTVHVAVSTYLPYYHNAWGGEKRKMKMKEKGEADVRND